MFQVHRQMALRRDSFIKLIFFYCAVDDVVYCADRQDALYLLLLLLAPS